MITLIESSIRLTGFRGSKNYNIFSSPESKDLPYYTDISTRPGEFSRVSFNYIMGSLVKSGSLPFELPVGKTEEEIKTMIIDAINNSLNS